MLRLKARAKINWSLDILGTREDGYHWMDMLMESVDLADELTFTPADTLHLTLDTDALSGGEDNLICKAARALQAATGTTQGAHITLRKRIPMGAGMGGGSADAAAAMIGLDRLWGTGLTAEALANIGLAIGADVPFMLKGGLARAGGIGEELVPLAPARPAQLVVVQPCPPLSTREVFQAYDGLAKVAHPATDPAQAALLLRDYPTLTHTAGNVLAQAAEAARPQIAEAVAALAALGAGFAGMTGSGSAVFGAFVDAGTAQQAYHMLHKRWRRCWCTHTEVEGITFLEQ